MDVLWGVLINEGVGTLDKIKNEIRFYHFTTCNTVINIFNIRITI